MNQVQAVMRDLSCVDISIEEINLVLMIELSRVVILIITDDRALSRGYTHELDQFNIDERSRCDNRPRRNKLSSAQKEKINTNVSKNLTIKRRAKHEVTEDSVLKKEPIAGLY